jgi:histidine triad (HIT) family protein
MTTDPDCLFCKIAVGDIPAEIVARGTHSLAFRDVAPKAPTHVLVIPAEHIGSLAELAADHTELLADLVGVANQVAVDEKLTGGYRVVTNVGPDAGQSVPHLLLHVLGGRGLGWPPG